MLFVAEPSPLHPTPQLLLYDNHLSSSRVTLATPTFTDHPSVAFRTDLMDARIYVCSPEVLLLMTENFDQQSMDEFVKGVLAEDILGGWGCRALLCAAPCVVWL